MHGLVTVDKDFKVLRPSIIWCDSRAVKYGEKAFNALGRDFCFSHLLNSPGNFTASKLAWVKENEPGLFDRIHKIMLPGDYVAMRMTSEVMTSFTGLSEGIFWDYATNKLSNEIMNFFGFSPEIIPEQKASFSVQGRLKKDIASELGLPEGIQVSYRAGDQPNNALSLNVLNPGEIAATAGTSGVIYGVAEKNIYDLESRVNTFAHVNYTKEHPNVGVLLCINGTGIQYNWLKQNIFENKYSYDELNNFAASVEIGSQGIQCFPFGNGAERVLKNADFYGSFSGINFNVHEKGHLIRAAQEGIVFAFEFGLDVMKSIGMEFNIIRAGNSNLFQSKVFKEAFVNTCNVNLEIYNTDGSQGAARGAGIGSGFFSKANAFKGLKVIERLSPSKELIKKYDSFYQSWKNNLNNSLKFVS